MVKTRMSVLDLQITAQTLDAQLRGARVTNIYDAHNGRTYILKLQVPPPPPSSTLSTPWQKRLLLLESGARLHLTQYDREKDVPTGFCLKLRKHIRAKRLESIRQLGGDRIVEMAFSAGGTLCARLVVECFAGGNVVLTDADYQILNVLRTYRPDSGGAVAVREKYCVEKARGGGRGEWEEFRGVVEGVVRDVPTKEQVDAAESKAERRKLVGKMEAKKALGGALRMEPAVVEHVLVKSAVGNKLAEWGEGEIRCVWEALGELEGEVEERLGGGGGVIVVEGGKYVEFSAVVWAQYEGREMKAFASFDEAVDEYFSKLEVERMELGKKKREMGVYKKIDKLERELRGQVSVFESARERNWEKARAIEASLGEVEAAITVVNSAVAGGVAWGELERMVEEEKERGNPVAETIHSLQLERNEVTLLLEDLGEEEEEGGYVEDGEEEDEEGWALERSPQTRKVLKVAVDLGLSAHANARRYYEMRKSAAVKMEKAVEVTDRTLKAATRRAANEAKKIEQEAVAMSIRAQRKTLWFEKFFWFVSSEKFLVVAGRDAQQNEMLVNRYLAPADVYVNADLPGASSVVVKNRCKDGVHGEIPRMTLEQAGTFAMSRSEAWEAKIVTSAWWVRASQVSKVGLGGEVLGTGSFAIRGKKNFLDPTQLVMGIAFVFAVGGQEREDETAGEALVQIDEGEDRGEEPEAELDYADSGPAGAGTHDEDGHHEGDTRAASEPTEKVEEAARRVSDAAQQSEENQVAAGWEAVDEVEKGVDSAGAGLVAEQAALVTEEAMPVTGESTEDTLGNTPQADDSSNTNSSSSPNEQDAPSTDAIEGEPRKVPRSKKKHLSAKERRALKSKSRNPPPSTTQDGEEPDTAAPEQKDKKMPKGSAPLPRGKKHKLKKMRKYKDQDEEERRIAMAVLGSKPIKEGDGDNEELSQGDENDEQAQVEGEKDGGKKQNRTERQEVMRMHDPLGLEELANLEKETIRALDGLKPAPSKSDSVQFALPVCAPYGALTTYRYKAKLMPGSMKRGKAYRSAIALFLKQAEKDLDTFKQERDAIRLSPESDGIHGMLGNVKIMAPGLAEAQKSLQKAKKVAAKKGNKPK